ncbi:MAG: DUF2326 domain-containing protein [Sphaerochaeta sp.]|nr:DUF2326 domain-containing protein [Sphaerochaeta sp.]
MYVTECDPVLYRTVSNRYTNIEVNPGTGSKKSQMASFDLAYIMFADKFDIPCLHFILQDQIENVHSNQITSLLTVIVDEVNCQYILPVLRDKLPTDIDIESMEILSLSQHDKLFNHSAEKSQFS